ncbi:MAG: hypothetical protein K2X38_17085 [Gemmataceae bacterium]|nr:hypothetical protein [Gemmataceae bacterium]
MNMKVESDSPPTIPEGIHQKLCYLLHRSLVEIRMLAWKGESAHIADLADTFEFVPSLLTQWRPEGYETVREAIALHQKKYPHGFDYCTALDMDGHEFAAVLGRF